MSATSLLSMDLSSVDTSRPVISQCATDFDITSVAVEESKKTAGQESLVIKLKTKYPVKSTKGEAINPGFTVMKQILLTPSGGWTEESALQELKRFQVAVGRSGAFGDPASYVGNTVSALVSVEVDKDGKYDDRNNIKFVPKGK